MIDLREVDREDPAIIALLERCHAYRSKGKVAVYAFAVYEGTRLVAAFLWNPPAPGASLDISPRCPNGVLALSRMVAVPRLGPLEQGPQERELKHISKPLRTQMRRLIDRTRWPILVTYSDESVGHTGYVYKCSGWTPTRRDQARTFTVDGARVSSYNRGSTRKPTGAEVGVAWIQRWEHHVPDAEDVFERHWRREPIPNRVWRSGNQAHRYVRREATAHAT